MERFWLWLGGGGTPRTIWKIFLMILGTQIAVWIWLFFVYYFGLIHFLPAQEYPPSVTWADIVILAPLMEEVMFRLFPIMVISSAGFSPVAERRHYLFWGIASSVIFGIMHGSLASILVQGVGGLALWTLFLYASRLAKDPVRGYLSAAVFHALHNLLWYLAP